MLAHARPHDDFSPEFHTRQGPFTLAPMPAAPGAPNRSSLVWAMSEAEAKRRVALDAEPRSTVTFELEPRDDQVKLTVTHGELLADGRIIELITEGWPRVVSDLKSVVEADDVVDGG